MNLAAGEVLARAKERGYSPQEIKPCIIRVLPGDRWIVDVESPHYPHPRDGAPRAAALPPPASAPRSLGVGGWMKRILSWFGIRATEACSCNKRARQMDEWGAAKCLANHREIVQWLAEEAKKRRLWYCDAAGYAVLALAVSLSACQSLCLGTRE